VTGGEAAAAERGREGPATTASDARERGTGTRVGPRGPRASDLRAVATRLFRERGFHATSMEDLAQALGMNRGSLYHYIEAKDDLLWEIVSTAMEELDATVRPLLSRPGPARLRLERAIAGHLAFAARSADALSLLQIELRSLAPPRRAALVARRDAYEALWRQAIADGIAAGEFRPVDVRLAGIAILSACNWFTQWFDPRGSLSVEEIARRFADLFLAGLDAGRGVGEAGGGELAPPPAVPAGGTGRRPGSHPHPSAGAAAADGEHREERS
jgi:AcrR family transcriptional regulator